MALAELLLIVLFFVGGCTARAVTPEEAAAIAQENANFDAEILYQQLTGGADEVIMDADAGEGNDDRDRVVCREGRCNSGPPEGWDKPGSGWKHPKIKKGASPCRFAGQDDTLQDRMAAWSMPKF